MSIPKYDELMLPLLRLASDRKDHNANEAVQYLSELFNLSESEIKEMLPSGVQSTIRNRTGWARTYLKKAGLLEYPKRGLFRITERGMTVIADPPEKIDKKYLDQFPEFIEFAETKKNNNNHCAAAVHTPNDTPLELLEKGFQELNDELAKELLSQVKQSHPSFFEKLVIDLLLNMGYGGSLKDAGKAIGKRGDEGVDGMIKEDKLGLDVIYVQAKRWEGTVSRPEIQKFVGAIHGKKARKGIFITTSSFSSEAKHYAEKVEGSNIVLLDGGDLTKYMIENDVGVSVINTYKVKRLDSDYFEE